MRYRWNEGLVLNKLAALIATVGVAVPAWGQEGPGSAAFELGTVVVTAKRPQVGEVAAEQVSSVVSREDSRWTSNTSEIAGFTTVNLKAVWRPVKNLSTEIGVNNLTDRNYELDYGYPNPGRMWFANARYQF